VIRREVVLAEVAGDLPPESDALEFRGAEVDPGPHAGAVRGGRGGGVLGVGGARRRFGDVGPWPWSTVLVRRGPLPSGLAPDDAPTRFGWSLTTGAT
jgi:hypothetical protein